MAKINAQQLVDGLYIAFYNRAADQPGLLYWENQVNLTQPVALSTTLTHQDYTYASPLGEKFYSTQSTYFNSQYAALNNTDFINKIYNNFGGNNADANGLAYWVNLLGSQSRQQVALRIAQDFLTIDLSLSVNLTPAELAAAQTRQQTFLNKVAVSESFAAASVNAPFLVAATASSSDPAFNAAIAIEQGVTSAASTVALAQSRIAAALSAGNVTPITTANAQPLTVPLTLGTDTITGSGAGSDVINAPVLFNAPTGTILTTLQTGDSITESGTNNTLNLTVGAPDSTISGVTISGVQTFNISNLGFAGAQPLIQGGNITGLTTVNNVSSTQAVTIGSGGLPLSSALTTIGVIGTAGTPNVSRTAAIIAPTALAGSTDALTVNATYAGNAATPARVLAGAATGTNGYETITVAATGDNFVGLGNPITGANSTTTVAVTGAGSVSLFGDGAANDFTNLATIDASAATGAVTVTGAATAGVGVGLLTGDTAVRSVRGGAGADVVDLSSMTLTQYNTNATTVDLGSGRDTLIVDNSVATTANTLARASGIEILGVRNPGAASGSIDFSKLPAGLDTVKLYGNQGGNTISLINAPGTLTFDAGTFGSNGITAIAASGTGTTDVLNLVEGSTTAGNINGESVITTGYETINLLAQGSLSTVAQVAATASAGGSVTLNITGSADLKIFGPASGPAIKGVAQVNISNSGLTTLATTVNTGATDAKSINAAASGGLVMGGGETGNVGSNGVAITGSSLAGKSNILIGSAGNDAITGGTANDVIATNGGADTIALGQHGKARVEVYGVDNASTDQTFSRPQGALTGSIVTVDDQAIGGFWGTVPVSVPISIFTLFPGTNASNFGTSVSQAVVSSFIAGAGGDVLDFSLKSFTPAAGAHRGLTGVDGTTAATLGDAKLAQVSSGSSLNGVAPDVVVIAGSTFTGAAQLAQALKTGTFGLELSANPTAGNIAHMLFAYNDGAGNGHIADVAIKEVGANRSFAAQTNIAAQDLVQLTGVSVGTLASNNINFVA